MRHENRSFDGSHNNQTHPSWGRAGTPLLRTTQADYADGVSSMTRRGDLSPNPRHISNLVCRQDKPQANKNGLSDYVWAWGQFIDHELGLTMATANTQESTPITVAQGDSHLPGGGMIPFKRSTWDPTTGTGPYNPRQQVNQSSSFIDGANVYGNNVDRANALRTLDGSGQLQVSIGLRGETLLPQNNKGLPNAHKKGMRSSSLFFAGDMRANENVVLTALHTLFVREHNRLCKEIVEQNSELRGNDDAIYQMARKIVGGYIQSITYNEFLPALLGDNAIKPYQGYDAAVNTSVSNLFATACYRFGHSMLSERVFLGTEGYSIRLRDAFFNPALIRYNGIEPFLSGLTAQVINEIDIQMVDDLRNYLFSAPDTKNKQLLDLAALNIQRGRDHGLPNYNRCREALGLRAKILFQDISSDSKTRQKLKAAYGDINNIDPWIGALAEDHVADANVGELTFTVLKDQFTRLRDGDRFWYVNDAALTGNRKNEISQTHLADIIRRNTNLINLPDDVFQMDQRVLMREAS